MLEFYVHWKLELEPGIFCPLKNDCIAIPPYSKNFKSNSNSHTNWVSFVQEVQERKLKFAFENCLKMVYKDHKVEVSWCMGCVDN